MISCENDFYFRTEEVVKNIFFDNINRAIVIFGELEKNRGGALFVPSVLLNSGSLWLLGV